MNRLIAGFLVGVCCWLSPSFADDDPAGAVVPTIKLLPDGSLPTNGSECVTVGSDGIARVNFLTPHRKRSIYDDYPHFPRNDFSYHDDGLDYDRYGVYLSLVNIDKGQFYQQHSYVAGKSSVYQEVVSSGNAGRQICFKRVKDKAVPSYFEFVARYFGEIAALNLLEYATAGAFNNFLRSGFSDSIPTFTMLHNQLGMSWDMQQLLQVKRGMSSTKAGFLMAIALKGAECAFSNAWYRPVTDLGASGSFTLFYSAPIVDGALNGIDDGVVTPVGEWFSPANGTDRQPGSVLVSDFFRGPLMLYLLHRVQSIWDFSDGTTGVQTNRMPLEMYSLTIVTTSSSRTFITNLNKNFLGDSSLLSFLHNGVIMITIASVDDPSNVITVYFDESIKGMSNDLLYSAKGYSDSLKSMDENLAWGIDNLSNFVIFSAAAAGAMMAIPATADMLALAWGYRKLALDSLSTTWAALMLVGLYQPRKIPARLKAVAGTAGTGLRATGKYIGQSRVVSTLSSSLVPTRLGAGQPPVYMNTGKIVGKAYGLSFTFNYVGPAFRRVVRALSEMISDASMPGSPFRYIFQTDRQFIIGHYVKP